MEYCTEETLLRQTQQKKKAREERKIEHMMFHRERKLFLLIFIIWLSESRVLTCLLSFAHQLVVC